MMIMPAIASVLIPIVIIVVVVIVSDPKVPSPAVVTEVPVLAAVARARRSLPKRWAAQGTGT